MNGYLSEALAQAWLRERVKEAEAWNRARAARMYARATRRLVAFPTGATFRAVVARALRGMSATLVSSADRLDRRAVLPLVGSRCAEVTTGVGRSRFNRI